MPDGSEFQTAEAATLKPREAKVVRTRGADNRLALQSDRPRDNANICGFLRFHILEKWAVSVDATGPGRVLLVTDIYSYTQLHATETRTDSAPTLHTLYILIHHKW